MTSIERIDRFYKFFFSKQIRQTLLICGSEQHTLDCAQLVNVSHPIQQLDKCNNWFAKDEIEEKQPNLRRIEEEWGGVSVSLDINDPVSK